MMISRINLVFLWVLLGSSILLAQESPLPKAPDLFTRPGVAVNSLGNSEIDIPVKMDLTPLYRFANQFIDTLYTSPNYPNAWSEEGCNLRYQYRFVRGPLQFKTINNTLEVRFSGYYGVRGSTRVCTPLGNSPYTPSCSCGFGTEKPRRLDAGFVVSMQWMPDYRLGLNVRTMQPVAVDKCEVCFFGKDITQIIVAQVKTELEASISAFRKKMEQFSLRPWMQLAWDSLQTPYAVPGFGFLSIQPSTLRLSQVRLVKDSMYASIGISAKPEIKTRPVIQRKTLPAISDFNERSGFRIFLAQTLPYDSLSSLVNAQIAGQDFSFGKGLLKKNVRVDSVKLLGGGKKMFIQLFLSKGLRGIFFLEGIPTWDPVKQVLFFDQLDYHIQSKQWLVKSAGFLLDGTITSKLREKSTFSMAQQLSGLTRSVGTSLNRALYPGVISRGIIHRISLHQVEAAGNGIFVQGAAEGLCWLEMNAQALLRQFL